MTNLGFEAAWEVADRLEGWLSIDQAKVLWDAAAQVPAGGVVVEIGSHRGRSTLVLALAAPAARVVAIDPFDNPRWGGGPASRAVFEENLRAAGVGNVELRADLSTEVRPTWTEPIDLLYVDGAHDFDTVSDDLEWARTVKPGGLVLMHDAFSSVGVTKAIYQRLAFRRDLEYLGRARSLASFKSSPTTLAGAARAAASGIWFARNLAVKICIRKGWRVPARILRQPDMSMPY